MNESKITEALTPDKIQSLFPPERSNGFFDAFYGDAEDSHFDIRLGFDGVRENNLLFFFELIQRPGKCLACNMTYGLPHVLSRHPIINVNGLVRDIASITGLDASTLKWKLGNTSERSSELHIIPLIISVEE